jgi:hypothetical protein
VSEFTPAGELVFDAQLATDYVSYRSFRMPWVGLGAGLPTVAVRRARAATDVYVSWNGDTRVTDWVALAGTGPRNLAPIGRVRRTGFETAMRVAPTFTAMRVRGVDARGTTLATSDLVRL